MQTSIECITFKYVCIFHTMIFYIFLSDISENYFIKYCGPENILDQSPYHTTKLNSLLSHHRTCVSLIVVNFHLQD